MNRVANQQAAWGLANGEAALAIGRTVRHQAFILGFSDVIIIQSAVLSLGLATALFLRGTSRSSAKGESR